MGLVVERDGNRVFNAQSDIAGDAGVVKVWESRARYLVGSVSVCVVLGGVSGRQFVVSWCCAFLE